MYGRLQILARLSEDFNELNRIFSIDPPDQFFFDANFLPGNGLSAVFTVANALSDVAIPIGSLTSVNMIVLFSDGPVTVKLAGGGTALPVGATGQSGVLVLVGAGVTTILVSNTSGAARKLRYFVGGA